MKHLPIICMLGGILFLAGCYKKVITAQGPNNSIILAYPTGNTTNSLSSGLANFNNALLNFSLSDLTDTLLISANLINQSVPNAAASDIQVTIGVDSSLVATYNSDTSLQSDTTHQTLALMPSAYYSIVSTTNTIAAGQNQVTFKVVFYPSLFDITTTGYLLPIRILNASGGSVDASMSTVYFHILKNPFPPFNRAGWKIIGFDCQETIGEGPNNGEAFYCLDGNTSTYWHTVWDTPSPPPFPHWIKIDMGTEQTLHGFSFLPRQSGGNTGDQFKDITIMATDDTSSWQQIGQFTLQDIHSLQSENLSTPVSGMRYFEVIINDNFDTNPWTNLTELYAY